MRFEARQARIRHLPHVRFEARQAWIRHLPHVKPGGKAGTPPHVTHVPRVKGVTVGNPPSPLLLSVTNSLSL